MHVTFLLTLQWYKVYQVISEISLPIFEKMTIIRLFLPLRFQIKVARAVALCCTIYQSGPPNPPKVKKLVVFETKKSVVGVYLQDQMNFPKIMKKSEFSKLQYYPTDFHETS